MSSNSCAPGGSLTLGYDFILRILRIMLVGTGELTVPKFTEHSVPLWLLEQHQRKCVPELTSDHLKSFSVSISLGWYEDAT